MNYPLQTTEYYLQKPGVIVGRRSSIKNIPKDFVLLAPVYTAICGSDQQYFNGEKSKEKLKSRLPLVPLHEGVCLDVISKKKVIPLGGDFRKVPPQYIGRENIWPDLPYLGATMNGLARTYFLYPKASTLIVPHSIPDKVSSITEPLSIALKAIKEMPIRANCEIAIIGTGGIAYLLALALRYKSQVPKKNITVYGISNTELKMFIPLVNTCNYYKKNLDQISKKFSIVFEAVGGIYMADTMRAAFQLCAPGSTVGFLGISDMTPPLPTNRFVNSNITLRGLTRSTIIEYKEALSLLKNSQIHKLITSDLINKKIFIVRSAKNIQNAFEYAGSLSTIGRVLLQWPSTL